ncbi:cellobiose dehydrogenase protein [Serendipita vermifera MAFF 305830]|uniref:Cellobiose dehydrogenase protein n=1 Tax=Serendipita vermifera MAFF 305830 TaxID=933852 RepID=A0A0C2XXZ6_SERVB|nr:cellobiose dehydrogenase protein [Serendipita vermifera MAFF 305830]
MKLWLALAGLLPFIENALAVNYCDPQNSFCFTGIQKFGLTDPQNSAATFDLSIGAAYPTDTTSTEFIGEIVATRNVVWAGYDFGGAMSNNLMLLVWTNGNNFVSSTRMASGYVPPSLYAGPIITQLPSSMMNATHWKFVYRCQNCTQWSYRPSGASTPTTVTMSTTSQVQSYGICLNSTSACVATPSSPTSSIQQHSYFDLWGQDVTGGRTSAYSSYLSGTVTSISVTVPITSTRTSTTTSVTPTTSGTGYDYIVVGGGAGGIIAADRLSEAGKKVLLLERGGPSTKETGGTREVPTWARSTGLTRFDIPGLFENMFAGSNPWWWCSDMTVLGGCLIGGGTVINGMLYFPPPNMEFAANLGWPSEWRDPTAAVTKLFARLPSRTPPSPDGKYYLDQVYTVLSTHFSKNNYSEVVINDDRDRKDGVYGHPAYNFNNGIRSGVTHTYLQTAKARSNFRLLMYTYAYNVVRNGPTITGVRTNNTIDLPNGIANLTPKGRVILSGGVYGTARMLFTSGIGPADMLSQVSKSSVANLLPPSSQYIDLPVGYYVSDNPSINFVFTHPSVDAYDNWQSIWSNPRTADANQYVASQTGVFASSSHHFVSWKAITGADKVTRYLQGMARPGGYASGFGSYNASATFSLTFYLSLGVTSRGRIGINSDLRGVPLVQPWFQDTNDKTAMISGITQALANISTNVPGIQMITPPSGTSIQSYVDNYSKASMGSNHWVGSTRIGANSSTAVVDTNCKVFNTDNLFILDAGIIPSQPMSNTHAAVMTIAEMGVTRILALAGGP